MHYSETASAESFDNCLPRRLGSPEVRALIFLFSSVKKNLCYDNISKRTCECFFVKIKKIYIKYGRIILYKCSKGRDKYERQINIYRVNGISGILVYCYIDLVDGKA